MTPYWGGFFGIKKRMFKYTRHEKTLTNSQMAITNSEKVVSKSLSDT